MLDKNQSNFNSRGGGASYSYSLSSQERERERERERLLLQRLVLFSCHSAIIFPSRIKMRTSMGSGDPAITHNGCYTNGTAKHKGNGHVNGLIEHDMPASNGDLKHRPNVEPSTVKDTEQTQVSLF